MADACRFRDFEFLMRSGNRNNNSTHFGLNYREIRGGLEKRDGSGREGVNDAAFDRGVSWVAKIVTHLFPILELQTAISMKLAILEDISMME